MADHDDDADLVPDAGEPGTRRRVWRKVALGVLGVFLVVLAYVWVTREDIADDVITAQLDALGLPATYNIESIGPREQVLTNIVIGDPQRPDLTIERAELSLRYGFRAPQIGQVRLVKTRIYGSFRGKKLSFGALDPILFDDSSDAPFTLPKFNLALDDARGLIESDYGPLGIKAQGRGRLNDGFKGVLAFNAPDLSGEGCAVRKASLFGKVAIRKNKPQFNGPLRLDTLNCDDLGLSLRNTAIDFDLTGDTDFAGLDAKFDLRSGKGNFGASMMAGLKGQAAASWRKDALTAQYSLTASDLNTPQATMSLLRGKGILRGRESMARLDWEGEWDGNDIRPGAGLDDALLALEGSSADTLLAPMIERVRLALQREGNGSRLTAQTRLRRSDGQTSLVVPQAGLRGGSGAMLLSLSRLQYSQGIDKAPRLFGNFTTGGLGLPRMSGRMDRREDGRTILRLIMAEYRAGGGSLAVPEFLLVQRPDGALGFSGRVLASGALPGGLADGLSVPVEGNWSQFAGLAVGRRCADIKFDRLVLAGLALERRGVNLCPPKDGAILRSDAQGTRIAAVTPSLDLVGHLGESPIRIRSGPVGFAMPGMLSARDLDIALGPVDTASRFLLTDLKAKIDNDISGRFAGVDVQLDAVPVDILDAAGDWRFANGRLDLSDAAFRIEDREEWDRFESLVAKGASLALVDNIVTVDALLREPGSDRSISHLAIRHDLASGAGFADFDLPGVVFDDHLQPDMLTGLALGVVANAKGVIAGQGRIDWGVDGVTSTGQFATDAFDFAAVFGPVQNVSGTIAFTDLLNLETAPHQTLRIGSINPGIEVENGELSFQLMDGRMIAIEGGNWPFMGGRLTLRPTTMPMGSAGVRNFVLDIEGLDAAQFIARMELANLSATGSFDGSLPLVFDENGGRIENGQLVSRTPGGSVSYIGELTYKDLSAMANFAFDALRALNYTEMVIGMDGDLTGELVTRVRFDGVKQGAGTRQNFLTRQVAKLPVRFNVNIRAPFYKLLTSVKAMYDPAFIRDPRELGLVDEAGEQAGQTAPAIVSSGKAVPQGHMNAEPAIQPPASETMP